MSISRRLLADVCQSDISTTDPRRMPDREFWYIDISAVDNVEKHIVSPRRVKGKDASVRARQVVRENDVLVATTRPNLNAVALVPKKFSDEICSTGFCVLRAGPEIDPEYLFLYVQSLSFIDSLVELTKGALYPAVTDKQVLSQSIPWIHLKKQRRIAKALRSQFDNLQLSRQTALTLLGESDSLSASFYRAAFDEIIPIATSPQFTVPPLNWKWHKLTDIAQLESGHTPSRSRPDWWGGDVSWISLTEIRALDGQWVENTQLRTNAAGIANSSARILPQGTVCFSRTASVGFVTIMARPMATSQDFANWICGEDLDPEFLMHALIRSRKELRELATGATHKTIYMPTLEAFHICAPSLPEQKRIVARLKRQLGEVHTLKRAINQQLDDLEALPPRILAQAFEQIS
jgi:type I restriction enzyme S subunit